MLPEEIKDDAINDYPGLGPGFLGAAYRALVAATGDPSHRCQVPTVRSQGGAGMDELEYEYRGLLAATWDLFRGDTSRWGDRPRFRDLIERHGQPALDVGCGTGRLLLDYLAEGLDVDGVDNSPEMLALCRAKAEQRGLRPTLYEQAIERLDLPRRYGTILVPSSTFQLITDPEQARGAMWRFFDLLLPGGALAMSIMAL